MMSEERFGSAPLQPPEQVIRQGLRMVQPTEEYIDEAKMLLGSSLGKALVATVDKFPEPEKVRIGLPTFTLKDSEDGRGQYMELQAKVYLND